jgi:hypothetical protein
MGRNKSTRYDDAYELYLSGLSLEQVANELSVTRQCVYKAFKQRGFSLRGVNFRPFQFFDDIKFTLRNNGYYSSTKGDRILMHRYVWQKYNGSIPDNYDIHHINNKKYDNRIENLECLPKAEHTRKYSPHHNQYTKNASHKHI